MIKKIPRKGEREGGKGREGREGLIEISVCIRCAKIISNHTYYRLNVSL